MAAPKTNNARVVPFIIMSLVTLILLIWAMQQCDRADDGYAMIAEEKARQTYIDSIRAVEQRAEIQKKIDEEVAAKEAMLRRSLTQPLPGDSLIRVPAAQKVIERVTPLYASINGLNVRRGPGLKNGVIKRLSLYEEVLFTGEVTDSLYTIDLGEIAPTAPWVKIRLKDGKEGWVYGACVSYYKYQLKGVYTD